MCANIKPTNTTTSSNGVYRSLWLLVVRQNFIKGLLNLWRSSVLSGTEQLKDKDGRCVLEHYGDGSESLSNPKPVARCMCIIP